MQPAALARSTCKHPRLLYMLAQPVHTCVVFGSTGSPWKRRTGSRRQNTAPVATRRWRRLAARMHRQPASNCLLACCDVTPADNMPRQVAPQHGAQASQASREQLVQAADDGGLHDAVPALQLPYSIQALQVGAHGGYRNKCRKRVNGVAAEEAGGSMRRCCHAPSFPAASTSSSCALAAQRNTRAWQRRG